jgi:hypothetical protein
MKHDSPGITNFAKGKFSFGEPSTEPVRAQRFDKTCRWLVCLPYASAVCYGLCSADALREGGLGLSTPLLKINLVLLLIFIQLIHVLDHMFKDQQVRAV